MAKENLANFATSQVAGTALTTSSTTLTVTTNTGSSFPSSTFLVTIDTEILLISTRSGDTLTIGMRAFDGTSIAPHVIGATVQQCESAYNLNHLWSNVPETFVPDVAPAQRTLSPAGVLTGTASSYDTEFETQGNWALYPTPVTGTTFAIGSALKSHLLFNRYGVNDNNFYSAYAPFSLTGAFSVTCKLSDAINFPQNGAGTVEAHFFVADQTNPTASGDTGNRFRIDIVTRIQTTAAGSVQQVNYASRFARTSVNVNGVWSPQSPLVPLTIGQTVYLRITTDGNNNWNAYVGDGLTFSLICYHPSLAITPQSLGFQFLSIQSNPYYTSHTVAVDFVRVVTGTALPAYGN